MSAPARTYSYVCEACEGEGRIDITPKRHWYNPDPAFHDDRVCDDCGGTGQEVLSKPDPSRGPSLEYTAAAKAVTEARLANRWVHEAYAFWRLGKERREGAGEDYWKARRVAFGARAHPLAQLRMVESAIGCDLACRGAVAAWRKAVAA